MKWYRIATSGKTTDGREIKPEWIQQMAKNYDKAKLTARIWLEHLRGIMPDGPFRAYGDVTALMAQKVEDGKIGLFAQLEPLSDMSAMINAGQKVFTSAEIDTNFLQSQEAYLVGLGITDSPASIGTDRLSFAQQTGIIGAKLPESHIVLAEPMAFTEATGIAASDPAAPNLFDQFKALFARQSTNTTDLAAFRRDLEQTLTLFATQITERDSGLSQAYRTAVDDLAKLRTEHAALAAKFAALHTTLDNTRADPPPSPATGRNGGSHLADY